MEDKSDLSSLLEMHKDPVKEETCEVEYPSTDAEDVVEDIEQKVPIPTEVDNSVKTPDVEAHAPEGWESQLVSDDPICYRSALNILKFFYQKNLPLNSRKALRHLGDFLEDVYEQGKSGKPFSCKAVKEL